MTAKEQLHAPTDCLIAGDWTCAATGASIGVTNPATDEEIARVPNAGDAEAHRAIEAAAAALPAWRALTAAERARSLHELARLMLRDLERLARILTTEQGKPVAEARGEIRYAVSFLEWAAEEGRRLYGDIMPASQADKRILVLRQPVGVCAAITPWNFPTAMVTRKLGPALACGCTIVIKPSELTPLSALVVGELAIEAGIPAGVVNIITGDPEAIGNALFESSHVRKISFTGSTPIGKRLIEKSAQNVIRLSLELGGHAPFIVFDDADLDRAVEGAVANKFRNMGQTCICANRFYLQDGVYEAFASKLRAKLEAMKIGPGLEEGVEIGPLINDAAVEKVQSHVADALSFGASVRTGGRLIEIDGLPNRFYAPTILDHVTHEMVISREETFGPVAPMLRFSREEEAIRFANDSPYGLASYFYTADASRLMRVAEALEYGIVGANDSAPSTAQAPFGGMKQSGYGREGGKYVMEEYSEVKYVSWQL